MAYPELVDLAPILLNVTFDDARIRGYRFYRSGQPAGEVQRTRWQRALLKLHLRLLPLRWWWSRLRESFTDSWYEAKWECRLPHVDAYMTPEHRAIVEAERAVQRKNIEALVRALEAGYPDKTTLVNVPQS